MRLLLVVALLPALALCAPQKTGDSPVQKLLFHCEFVPQWVYFAAESEQPAHLPTYTCKNNETKTTIELASPDLASGNNWVESADVQLSFQDLSFDSLGYIRVPEDITLHAVPNTTVTLNTVNIFYMDANVDDYKFENLENPNHEGGFGAILKWFKPKSSVS